MSVGYSGFMSTLGPQEVAYVQTKSAHRPETSRSDPDDPGENGKSEEIPVIFPVKHLNKESQKKNIVKVEIPPPNSIAEVLEPIARVIYKEKTYRREEPEVRNKTSSDITVWLVTISNKIQLSAVEITSTAISH